VWFTATQLCVVTSVPVQTHAPTLDSGPCDGFTYDLKGCGLVAWTATDAHDAAVRIPCSLCNDWGASLLKEGLQ